MRCLAWLILVLVVGCQREARPPASPTARKAATSTGRGDAGPAAASLALPGATPAGQLEVVATFTGPMPTGVAVARGGRVFVCFPRWGDPVAFTVAELVHGKPVPFPDAAMNDITTDRDPSQRFVSVQSVVVDPQNRLWVLDTGAPEFGPPVRGGAKLVAIDLTTNRVVRTIVFSESVALPTSYLGNVRLDLRRGSDGMAFLTDASDRGPNALIVVDLASGMARRRLVDHASVKAEPGFLAFVEGRPLMVRTPGQPPQSLTVGADGIAISGDGATLYYSPLASRHLYAIATDALVDPTLTDAELTQRVRDLGEKGASDGLEADAQGRVYATQYEHNAIVRLRTDGTFETIAADPRLLWPDSLALADDGYLYVTANQRHRQARFAGQDTRERPYALFRVRTDGRRVVELPPQRTTLAAPHEEERPTPVEVEAPAAP